MLRTLLLGVAPAIVCGFSDPTLGSDGVLHAQYGKSLYAVNADGSTKWIFGTGDPYWLHAEGLNGTVYVATVGLYDEFHAQPAILFALDSSDGSIKWEYQLTGHRHVPKTIEEPLVVTADGTVYLTSGNSTDTTIDAFDAKGALKWTATAADGQSGPSAVGDDGTVFVLGRQSLVALRPETGTVRWSLKFQWNRDLKVIAEDGNVFLMELDPYSWSLLLTRLSNEDGSSLWTVPLSAWHNPIHAFRSMTVGSNMELYVNNLAENGTCILSVFDFDGNTLRSLPCLNSNAQYDNEEDMFVHVSSNNVLARSGADGSLLWNVSVGNGLSRGAHFGQNGTVFVWTPSEVGPCHAIRNGEVAWSVQAGGPSRQIMSEDGITYVQGSDIIAVGADDVEKWRYTPTEAAVEFV